MEGKSVITTFDPQDLRSWRKKWRNREEYDTVADVRERFLKMQEGRRKSCPWTYPDDSATSSTGTKTTTDTGTVASIVDNGTDWKYRWDMDYKLWSMWHKYLKDRSNLKSPISFAPIEAAMAEFKESNLGILLSPTEESDIGKVKVYTHILEYIESKSDIARNKAQGFHQCLITGSSPAGIMYLRKERDVDLILNSEDAEIEIKKIMNDGDDKAKNTLKERLNKKPLSRKERIIEYDDVIYVPTSIYDMYFDPDAICVRGPYRECTDLVWRSIMSLEQFKSEFRFSRDPYVVKENIDHVVSAKTAQADYGADTPFFRAPNDVIGEDQVEVLKYYNKQTDKYIIIANDILVREGPLPYNHKELPFVLHKFGEFDFQLYGWGIPVILESLQAEDETLRNLFIEQLKINLIPPVLINSSIYGEVDQQWQRLEPGLKIEVAGSVGPENIRWFQGSQPNYEYFKFRDTLREDAISAIGINPMAYSMPQANTAVRTHMMTMESTLKMLKKGIKNWAESGYKDAARQMIAIVKQMYSLERITDITGEKKKNKPRSIKIKGYKIIEDNGVLREQRIDGESYLELKSEYLDLDGDVDIKIDIDSLVPMSKGLEIEKIKEALVIVSQYLANPQLMAAPGMLTLIRKYIEKIGLGQDVLEELQDEDSEEEVVAADRQNESIMKGEPVPGIPGESEAHKWRHIQVMMQLLTSSKNPSTVSVQDDTRMRAILTLLNDHLQGDATPKQAATDMAMAKGQEFLQAPPPGMSPGNPPISNMDVGRGNEMPNAMQAETGMSPELMMQAAMEQGMGPQVGVGQMNPMMQQGPAGPMQMPVM